MNSSRLLGTLFITETGIGDVLGEIKRDYPAKFESQKMALALLCSSKETMAPGHYLW